MFYSARAPKISYNTYIYFILRFQSKDTECFSYRSIDFTNVKYYITRCCCFARYFMCLENKTPEIKLKCDTLFDTFSKSNKGAISKSESIQFSFLNDGIVEWRFGYFFVFPYIYKSGSQAREVQYLGTCESWHDSKKPILFDMVVEDECGYFTHLLRKMQCFFLVFDHRGTLESWGHGFKDGKYFVFIVYSLFYIIYVIESSFME